MKKSKAIIKVATMAALLVGILSCPAHALQKVRRWTAPDHTRISLDLQVDVPYKYHLLYHPCRIEIELFRDRILNPGTMTVEDGVVKRITWKYRDGKQIVTIELEKPYAFNVFTLKPTKAIPYHRVVIDIMKGKEVVEKQREEREETARKVKAEKKFIVVLDPGHGGNDPGAIGRYGIREKDIVLRVAKLAQKAINRNPHMKAYLTRNGDYFVPLYKRVQIAHDYKADIFISIHCNTAPSRKAKGVMVFTLSNKGASDSLASMLAKIENTADMMSQIEFSENKYVNRIILDLAQDYSLMESRILGDILLRELVSRTGLKSGGLKRARFVVLKNPGIPSALVELGFISNPQEAQMIRSYIFQERAAEAIAHGAWIYLDSRKEVPNQEIASKNSKPYRPRHLEPIYLPRSSKSASRKKVRTVGICKHKVRRGESLSVLAKRYGTTVSKIKRANHLRSSRIRVGQILKIPSKRCGRYIYKKRSAKTKRRRTTKKNTGCWHTVKKGETLAKIAKRNRTTVSVLKRINGLKSSLIRPGQRIYLPASACRRR